MRIVERKTAEKTDLKWLKTKQKETKRIRWQTERDEKFDSIPLQNNEKFKRKKGGQIDCSFRSSFVRVNFQFIASMHKIIISQIDQIEISSDSVLRSRIRFDHSWCQHLTLECQSDICCFHCCLRCRYCHLPSFVVAVGHCELSATSSVIAHCRTETNQMTLCGRRSRSRCANISLGNFDLIFHWKKRTVSDANKRWTVENEGQMLLGTIFVLCVNARACVCAQFKLQIRSTENPK